MVAILRPPKRFSRIAGVFQQKDSITQFQEKGSITHYIDRIRYVNKAGCAICTDIYSKSDAISHEKIKKLGTFAELVCVHDLQKIGIKSISTTDDPHISRIKQLSDCPLPLCKETPIMD